MYVKKKQNTEVKQGSPGRVLSNVHTGSNW